MSSRIPEKSTSRHFKANSSLRRRPVVTSKSTIERKHDFSCAKRLLDLAGFQHFGNSHALRALADEGNGIPSLFKPFVANGMVEQNTHEISNFRFGPVC